MIHTKKATLNQVRIAFRRLPFNDYFASVVYVDSLSDGFVAKTVAIQVIPCIGAYGVSVNSDYPRGPVIIGQADERLSQIGVR